MTEIKLELIPKRDMFEKGIRCGIFYISNRYSKAKKKYLKSFDQKQEPKHIIYLDPNKLYGYASGFKWTDPKELDLNKYTSNSSKGCVLKVEELRELNNDYPLAPDKLEIKREMLSEYQLKIADLYNIIIGNVKKLLLDFFNKEKSDLL